MTLLSTLVLPSNLLTSGNAATVSTLSTTGAATIGGTLSASGAISNTSGTLSITDATGGDHNAASITRTTDNIGSVLNLVGSNGGTYLNLLSLSKQDGTLLFRVSGTGAVTANNGLSVTGALTTTSTINGLTVSGGAQRTSNGYQAGSVGTYNQTFGYQAGKALTSGDQNSFFGWVSGSSTTSGASNSSFGNAALYTNTTGSNNTALGQGALQLNTTASNNTAVGYQAGYTNSTGASLALFGYQTGVNITGSFNNGFGYNALPALTSGTEQIGIGYQAGRINQTGSGGIYIGSSAAASGTAVNNEILIGTPNSTAKGANTAFINANGGASYNGANVTTWATTSDRRIKENIIDLPPALDKLSALRTVEFDYKESGKHEVGFIAQEYETVFPDQIITHAPSEAEKAWVGEDGEVKAIQQNLTPYLVKAIQELSAKNAALEARLSALENK